MSGPSEAAASGVDVIARLRAELGDRVLTGASARELCAHDESHHDWAPPLAVVACDSTAAVAAALRTCHEARCPVVPFGAGTGLEGGANATSQSVTLDLSGMNRILRVSGEDLDATVEAGVTRLQLNAALAREGMFFPVDPGADASLGGMAATRASGTNAVRYGTMRENVLALTVVLADGTVVHTGGRARKSAAGFDLTRLFVGSEGTLGVITEVTLRLQGIPEHVAAAVSGFPTLHAAAALVQQAIALAIPLSRVELLDEVMIAAVNAYSGLQLPEVPTLFFEFAGTEVAVADQLEEVRKLAAEHGAVSFETARSPADSARLWKARHDALPACKALVAGSHTWSTDVCVPISRLAQCVVETKDDIDASDALAPIAGHIGDGNFHLAFVLPPGEGHARKTAEAINERLVQRALAMGGTCTGEHGVGTGKRSALREEHPDGVPVMRALKAALDPKGILNPGKVL